MAQAEIIDITEITEPGPQGELQTALRPVFILEPFSGSFSVGPIPQDDFSRERVVELITDQAQEMLPEDEEITVVFPGE